MSVVKHHAEWLSLVEVSGPFLSTKVLCEAFPQGLDTVETELKTGLRSAYDEWLENQGGTRPDAAIHQAWVRFVLREALDCRDEHLLAGQALPASVHVDVREHGEHLAPDLVLVDEVGRPRILVVVIPLSQKLEAVSANVRWKASPATRMMTLLHGAGVKLGLVSNGEHWMLVYAEPGKATTYVSFYSGMFFEEPPTLRAFVSLLGARRLFGVGDDEVLEALLAKSENFQDEVTDQLGLQVRRAVEILIQTIDRIDRDRGRELLRNTDEKGLYEAAVTVMMRLVFMLSAEEQRLLPTDEPIYEEHYAISPLRGQLDQVATLHGEEVLEHRYDAWSRLLATFRAVHGGVQHDRMRLPAYGGSLFDPDRFPFLEGRADGTSWKDVPAEPLGIDSRTVLHLLRALQLLEVKLPGGGPVEARRLSFRALGVEQIGHVYEGLLDHTAKRAEDTVLGLQGASAREAEVSVVQLEKLAALGEGPLHEYLSNETGRGVSTVARALKYQLPEDERRKLLLVCDSQRPTYERVSKWAGLVRQDSHGRPVVVSKGSIYVTGGDERRATGTHYTPPSLTEPIVRHTLEPQVYDGPSEGWAVEKWKLKSAKAILALRVCDMAMGSGAFLVQACRYLAERLVEAWDAVEAAGGEHQTITPEGLPAGSEARERVVPRDPDERLTFARRLVSSRCLYGVDRNPMAVEMAKLSLWLITLQKDKPFTFVDHALRAGDSLLGLVNLAQIKAFHTDPARSRWVQEPLFDPGRIAGLALERAIRSREEVEAFAPEDIRDCDRKARLLRDAIVAVEGVRLIADVIVAAALSSASKGQPRLEECLEDLGILVRQGFGTGVSDVERGDALQSLRERTRTMLEQGRGARHPERRTFHWLLEFPEVVLQHGGFDAIVGNPPFMYGTLVSTALSVVYAAFLQDALQPWHAKADYCAAFLRRSEMLLADGGVAGLLLTASAVRGETLDSGLAVLARDGYKIAAARSPFTWPGAANVDAIWLVLAKRWADQCSLDGRSVRAISLALTDEPIEMESPDELSSGIEGFLGVKIAPGNSPRPREEVVASYGATALPYFVPAPGGDELYNLVDICESPMVVAPERIDAAAPRELAEIGKRGHSRPAADLLGRLGALTFAFACGETSVHLAVGRIPVAAVLPRHKLVVFPTEDWGIFAVLQSTVHDAWAWRWGLRRRIWLTYSPKRCARTLPSPVHPEALRSIGRKLFEERTQFQKDRVIGLTALYNIVHSVGPGGDRMREVHRELDREVFAEYGWDDLVLDHEFRETPQGVRFTIGDASRRDLLNRLRELNHARHSEEQVDGVPATASAPKGLKAPRSKPRRAHANKATQTKLFGED